MEQEVSGMEHVFYFIEGGFQAVLGILNVVHAILYSKKAGKVMNLISGIGFVVLGVLSCVVGCNKIRSERKICDESIGD
ncbi:MAG TPA: hypothetical protein DCZ91_23450 [Lachnospiraceae bacterium]|nr:hypothetical protein [Lachnospiraceae bacterium]